MQHIEIQTAQNVTIEYELATLGERILAFFIDGVVVIGVYTLFVLALVSSGYGGILLFGSVIMIIPIVLFMLYSFLTEALGKGRSLGKRSLGLKVVRTDGQIPSLSDYLLRAVFHFVDTLMSGGILAVLFISSTPNRQRLGDMTAGTTVIKNRSHRQLSVDDLLRIGTLDDYEPRYPEVKRYNEEDMLFIKLALSRWQQFPNEAHQRLIRDLSDKLARQMNVAPPPPAETALFLRTLIQDYIVLTR